MDDKFNNYILDERTFLHDVSNQLVIVQGMGDFILSHLKKVSEPESKEVIRMEKVMKASKKIVDMVIERRDKVKATQATL